MQRFRFDREGEPCPNGSRPVYSEWLYGPSLAGVRACPCPDGRPRTVYIQSEPGTYFSFPAATRIKGKYTRGYVTCDEYGYTFHALESVE